MPPHYKYCAIKILKATVCYQDWQSKGALGWASPSNPATAGKGHHPICDRDWQCHDAIETRDLIQKKKKREAKIHMVNMP